MYFSSNIKLLRKRRKLTQDELAENLKMKRSTLSGYENQVAQPNVQVLMLFSDFFKVAIDSLIRIDLEQLNGQQLWQLENGSDVFIRGGNIRILATTISPDNKENIELVHHKAKAGYTSGFADPDYIKSLPVFNLPFLDEAKKYRTFQISGDSMLPIPDKSFVTGEFLQDWTTIKSFEAGIVVTIDDGIVFKVIENRIAKDGALKLYSLNKLYDPYLLPVTEVREIWKFTHYISNEMPEAATDLDTVLSSINTIKVEVEGLKKKLS